MSDIPDRNGSSKARASSAWQRARKLLERNDFVTLFLVILSVVISLQNISLGLKTFNQDPPIYRFYNNYVIFKQSFFHLVNEQDLYILYPSEHWDLFKYSPTFALFFGIFAWMPDWLGQSCWLFLNSFVLLIGIRTLPVLSQQQKTLAFWLCLIELVTSLQNQQSNALIAGLLLLSFSALENRNYLRAAFFICSAVFIKPFALAFLPLYLFYPGKIRNVLCVLAAMVLLALPPLIVIDSQHYLQQVLSYRSMIAEDHSASLGYSVMGILNPFMNAATYKSGIVLGGLLILLLPYLRVNHYRSFSFRLFSLLSILVWVVIFNHKAESPTFVIAMAALCIWIVYEQRSLPQLLLFAFAFVLTGLSATDIFPKEVRENYVNRYALKALPCILIWMLLAYRLLFSEFQSHGDRGVHAKQSLHTS